MNTGFHVPGIIALDLDGTVLTSDHKTITPRTYAALQRCQERGSWIVPTTGRCESIIPLDIFPNVRYVISGNGSYITDYINKTVLRATYLQKEDVLTVWEHIQERVRKYNLVVELFEDSQIVVEQRILDNLDLYRSRIPAFHLPLIAQGKAKYVSSFDSYLQGAGEKIIKINFPGKNIAECPELPDELLAMNRFEITSDGLNLEITKKGCCKGEALLWLAHHLNLPVAETVAFGDGNNDLSMLRMAGFGVAMGNAAAAVQQAAPYCTQANTADGIAVFLEKHFPDAQA